MTQMSQIGDDEGPEPRAARDAQTHEIIGAAMAVHSELGSGFLEAVYQEALAIELAERRVEFTREQPLVIHYRGQALNCGYRADFICYNEIIVELKAQSSVGVVEQAQIINYLKATGFQRALLLNFGAPRLEYRRIVRGYQSATSATSAVKETMR
jgi:GxxExxY protein